MVNSFFDKCMGKLTGEEELPKSRRNAIMDLSISMVLYVDKDRIAQVCKYVAPLVEVSYLCRLNKKNRLNKLQLT